MDKAATRLDNQRAIKDAQLAALVAFAPWSKDHAKLLAELPAKLAAATP